MIGGLSKAWVVTCVECLHREELDPRLTRNEAKALLSERGWHFQHWRNGAAVCDAHPSTDTEVSNV